MTDLGPATTETSAQNALVVDDNSAICILLKTVIERRGYRVLTFGDAQTALRYLEANQPQLRFAIVDVGLGGMDGFELARHLRRLQPGIGLILSTGRNLSPAQTEFTRQHGVFFLPKPFNVGQLTAMVTSAEQRGAAADLNTGT